jgi:hypothetical protein
MNAAFGEGCWLHAIDWLITARNVRALSSSNGGSGLPHCSYFLKSSPRGCGAPARQQTDENGK